MTMSRTDSAQSPLTVKEQFEASANRFWSTVKNISTEDKTMKGNQDKPTPPATTTTIVFER